MGSYGGNPRWCVSLTALTVTLMLAAGASAQSTPNEDRKHFSGVYLGANLGSQNLFGGAFINDIDVLAQDSRRVIVFSGGVRHQFFGDRLLAGAEIQYGLTDGNLTHFDPPSQSNVSYENNSQTGFGLTFGYSGGSGNNVAIFSYAFAIDRSFEIGIVDPANSYGQTDGQSFLQYGLGAEVSVLDSWHVRALVGRQIVDFGDLVTNIELEKKFDLTLGVAYQL